MTDFKLPDAQAGHEKGCNHTLVGNAGANLIYEAAGRSASLLGFCLERLVIDNDSIGAALRTGRGIEVSDETLSIEVIRDVCLDARIRATFEVKLPRQTMSSKPAGGAPPRGGES